MKERSEIYQYNLTILESIRETSDILEKHYGIKFLTYRKFTNDGMLFHVSGEASWLDCSLEHDFLISNSSIHRMKSAKIGKLTPFLWPNSSGNDKTYQALFQNNFCNGVTVYEKFRDQVEFWAFYTSQSNENAHQIYINNFEIIERFIQFFKQKHHDIVCNTDKSLLLKTNINEHASLVFVPENRNKFLEETNLDKFVIKDINGKNTLIPIQQIKSMYYLSQGYNIRMIAKKLNISPRTIEDHVNSAKTKLKCFTTCQLKSHITDCILDGIFIE